MSERDVTVIRDPDLEALLKVITLEIKDKDYQSALYHIVSILQIELNSDET